MNYIVLDLEWNQPYSRKSTVRFPVYLQGEIIQIGAVKLDEQFALIDTFKVIVKPKYYRVMHKQVSRLTSISNEDLQYGFPLKQAIAFFKAWCPEDATFLTWGGEDIKMLRTNLAIHKMSSEWIPNAYDVQQIFGQQLAKESRQYSLLQAMEVVQEAAYSAHDALHDALNTAKILHHLDMERGFTEYTVPRTVRHLVSENGYQEVSDEIFPEKEDAFAAWQQQEWICPRCGESISFSDWLRQNSEKRIAIGTCGCGSLYFARIRVRPVYDQYRPNRIVYPLTDELKVFYQERLETEQKKNMRRLQYSVPAVCV